MHNNLKNNTWRSSLLWAVLLVQIPLTVMAQDPPADLQPLEDLPPPTISKDGQDPDEPQVTIVKKKGETVEEYRINGQLYMMKIIPDHGTPYYLHKEDQEGGWINDGPNPPLVIPKWTLFRF